MIRIDRGPSPETIVEKRRTHLSRAMLAWARDAESGATALLLDDYQAGKRELYLRQHRKCAYCERPTGLGSQPTEHFRPKDGARRSLQGQPQRWDRDHYWWLTWTWENLLFACSTCNGSKLGQFPLEPGSPPLPSPPRQLPHALPPECFRLDLEKPLLLDPAVDDPLDHIEWRPTNPGAPVERLRWRPVHKTSRGKVTIAVLGWEKLGLADHVNTHISRVVHPRVLHLREAISRGDETSVRSVWTNLLNELFDPDMPHLAATHDALIHFVSADERLRWGLHLPRPGMAGVEGAHVPPPVLQDPPGFEGLPVQLQWELRALGERADPAKRDHVLVEMCRFRPSTAETLSGLTRLGLPHMQRCLEALVANGALARQPDEGPGVYRAVEVDPSAAQ